MAVNRAAVKQTRVRWIVLAILFLITTINYADRATISIAGPSISASLKLNPVSMGYIFSAFGWAYVASQLPGGWLLDRFGSKRVYSISIFLWSVFTLMQGEAGFFAGMAAIVVLFSLRFLLGAAEAPSFPANSRIVAAWFPEAERGTASAIFNSAQYAATVVFAPLMAWLVHAFSWHYVFVVMGTLGLLVIPVWNKLIFNPMDHPHANRAEIEYIEQGGALVNMDRAAGTKGQGPTLSYIKELLTNRMMLGIYIAQYCINAITFFFITWFPPYLVNAGDVHSPGGRLRLGAGHLRLLGWNPGRHRVGLPAQARRLAFRCTQDAHRRGYAAVDEHDRLQLGGFAHARPQHHGPVLLRQRHRRLGLGSELGHRAKQIAGLSGGLLNTCGNLSSITTPIAIGYIINQTGSFNGALIYVGMHAFAAIVCYLFVVGEIKRVVLE